MPSVTFGNTTFNQEQHILASEEGIRRRPALTVDENQVQLGVSGNKIVRPGSILYKDGNNNGRLNVRTKTGAAVTAAFTTFIDIAPFTGQYDSEMVQFLDDGDVLQVLRPYSFITLADTWDADDTAALVIDGQSVTYTPGSADLNTAASNLAVAINADFYHSKLVEAVTEGSIVYIFSRSRRTYSLAVTATTTGDGTATANDATLVGGVEVGTIDAGGVNVSLGTVTLAAAAAVSLPSGAPIGVSGWVPYSVVKDSFNLAEGETDISGLLAALIYGERLPYWDEDIASELP
ncbi:MAG: hypothetical protein AAF609_14905, partial [Cyanobacteria bacterium P01_C01_bin.120]